MSGYCKYCDSLIDVDEIVRAFDDEHRLIWVGCLPDYQKRLELMHNDKRHTN